MASNFSQRYGDIERRVERCSLGQSQSCTLFNSDDTANALSRRKASPHETAHRTAAFQPVMVRPRILAGGRRRKFGVKPQRFGKTCKRGCLVAVLRALITGNDGEARGQVNREDCALVLVLVLASGA